MSSTWIIELSRLVSDEEFDQVAKSIGLNGHYNDSRVIGDKLLAEQGLGGVEIDFSGLELSVRVAGGHPQRYEAMKKTTTDLGARLPFKSISGEWFDDVSKQSLPYNSDVYRKIERT